LSEALISTSDIYLPGGIKQFEHLLELPSLKGNHALIIGAGCEPVAKSLLNHFEDVSIITDDYAALIQSRLKLRDENKIKVKMMEYSSTDFSVGNFDLIYAQGSLTVPSRKLIVKEIKRILSADGLLCVGEIVALREPIPAFVNDIWERNGLEPLTSSQIINFYSGSGFELVNERELTNTLKEYYKNVLTMISKTSKGEIEENKKFISRFKHESNACLKLSGDKYMGFKSLILRNQN
jgi:SAM-dependent methyltransferase